MATAQQNTTHDTADGAQTANHLIGSNAGDVSIAAFIPADAEAEAVREAYRDLGAEIDRAVDGSMEVGDGE